MLLIHDGNAANFKELHSPLNVSETKLQILRTIKDRPKDLTSIAKEVGTTEQNAHYHLRALIDAGIVEVVHGERKLYTVATDAFGYVIRQGRPYRGRTTPQMIEHFFAPLAEDGRLRTNIVVGAPDPHGVFMQRARDGHYVGVLGLFLGQFFSFEDFPVMVDTDVRAERLIGENLILLGGPAANTATWELLDQKKIFFNVDNPWAIRGKHDIYADDNYGLVAKFRNPYNEKNWVILLAGVRAVGTKAAVIALTNYWEQILANYRENREYYWIVQGFDRNADGHVDVIQVKEYGEIPEGTK
ncbi:MAG: helix-turn-helix domain-containing protein [Candidatus Diapherotrites archaeon]|nr:helix-turn-helix domain-containing protein [Candidatus Diapherotrites archaeon]